MRITLDPSDGLPLYQQLANGLRAAIAARDLAPDQDLPSLRELAADLRVNFHTVGRAYKILEEEGLLERQRGGPYKVARGVDLAAADAIVREEAEKLVRLAWSLGVGSDELFTLLAETWDELVERRRQA